jgi:hypothetical protein
MLQHGCFQHPITTDEAVYIAMNSQYFKSSNRRMFTNERENKNVVVTAKDSSISLKKRVHDQYGD